MFKAVLDAVMDGSILQRHHGIGRVDIQYRRETFGMVEVTMKQIMAMQAEYVVDGQIILLKGSQRFDFSRIEGEDEKRDYLRSIAMANSLVATASDAECATQERWDYCTTE